jgi:putative DNA primase/helicase
MDMDDISIIRSALPYLSAQSRDTWILVGMAVKSSLGDAGFSIWDAWSQTATNYNQQDALSSWKSFSAGGGGVTLGSLIFIAKKNGWRGEGPSFSQGNISRQAKEVTPVVPVDEEKQIKQLKAALIAKELWDAGEAVSDDSYLHAKGCQPVFTLRQLAVEEVVSVIGYHPRSRKKGALVGQILLVPVVVDGQISSVEMIDSTGRKAALSGGKKSGAFWAAQEMPEGDGSGDTFLVGEGVATVLSAMEATSYCGVAALSCHNLRSVTIHLKKRYPMGNIIVLADLGNGQDSAIKAAAESGSLVAIPAFPEHMQERGSDFNDLAQTCGLPEVHRQVMEAHNPRTLAPLAYLAEEDGPLPLRRALPRSEAFPLSVLPPVLRNFADLSIKVIQAPCAMVGQSILAAASLAVQSLGNVSIDGRSFPLSCFFLTVGASGERKSGSYKPALQPFWEYERQLIEASKSGWNEYCAELESWKRDKGVILKKGENVRQRLIDLGPEPSPPLEGQIIAEEPTFEGIYRLLQNGQPSIAVFSDEGGRFLGGHGMMKDNQLKTVTGFSTLWDGAPITRTRSGDGSSTLYGRRCAIHLMMQPNIARDLFGNTLLLGQGFLSRCLIAYPESKIGNRPYLETDLFQSVEYVAYFEKIMQLLHWSQPIVDGTRNELSPREIVLSGDAKKEWVAFHDDVEREMREGGELFFIRGFAAKAAEHAARLAGVVTLVQDPEATEISVEAVFAGIELLRFYLKEALRLFHTSNDDPDLILAEKCLEWCASGEGVFSLPCLYQKGPSAVRNKKTASHIVEILEQHNSIRKIEGGAVIDGKRRRDVWRVVT